jgi:uncharacterized phage protein (TIGR02218 family)
VKSASADMITHLAGRQHSLVSCLKLKRKDGQILAFTEHDQNITFDAGDGDGSQVYKAAQGYTRTAVSSESGLEVDNVDLEGLLAAGGLELEDVRAGLYDGATALFFLVNWRDLSMGKITLRKGRLGKVTPRGGRYTAELQGLADRLARGEILETWSPGCRADLGDDRCQADLTGLSYAGVVSAVASRSRFTASAFVCAPAATDSTYLDGGVLTWTSGNNNGSSIEVRTYTHGTKVFILPVPLPYALQVGDGFTVQVGCDKKFTTCKNRFDNAVNFRGEPHVPEGDKIRINPTQTPGGGLPPGQGA